LLEDVVASEGLTDEICHAVTPTVSKSGKPVKLFG